MSIQLRGTRRRAPVWTTTAAIAWTLLAAGSPAVADRPLGEARLLSGPTPCNGSDCYELEVACDQLAESAGVELKVDQRTADSDRGTILFMSGGGGRALWERFGSHARAALETLREAGFRTVQIAWRDAWLHGARGHLEGHAKLACRPATVARWIHDNLHRSGPETAMCATGNSGGAAQSSYMISHYGLAEILSAVVPTGGPPMGRIDLGCLPAGDPGKPPIVYVGGQQDRMDRGFGFYGGDGPCASDDRSFRRRFRRASVATRKLERYVFPRTLVWFVFGENDNGSAVGQALPFYERLLAAGSPLVEMSIAPDTPHATPSTREGAEMIRDVLLEGCVPRD